MLLSVSLCSILCNFPSFPALENHRVLNVHFYSLCNVKFIHLQSDISMKQASFQQRDQTPKGEKANISFYHSCSICPFWCERQLVREQQEQASQKPRVTAREADHMPTTPKEEEQTRSAGQLTVQWSLSIVYSVKAGSYNMRRSTPATLLRHGPKPKPELKFSFQANGCSSHGQELQMWSVRAIRVFGVVRALREPYISPVCIMVSVEAWKEHVPAQFLIQKIKEPWAWGLSWFMPFQQLSHDHYFWDISIKTLTFRWMFLLHRTSQMRKLRN